MGWTVRRLKSGGGEVSASVQTGPAAYSASYTMVTGSFPGVKRLGRGVDQPSHLALRLKKDKRFIYAFTVGCRLNVTISLHAAIQ
jgi:hypothetical protein